MDCSSPSSSAHGVLQARILEREIVQLGPTPCNPVDCSLPGPSVHGIFQAKILEWVAIHSPGGLPNPGAKPRPPALQVDSLLSEPPGKPKNTGVGSLSLLQGIFPTQELNWGLLPWRWILYQLSYQGSPESVGMPFLLASLHPHKRCIFNMRLKKYFAKSARILYLLT